MSATKGKLMVGFVAGMAVTALVAVAIMKWSPSLPLFFAG